MTKYEAANILRKYADEALDALEYTHDLTVVRYANACKKGAEALLESAAADLKREREFRDNLR